MTSYVRDAEECQIGEDDWDVPNEIMCRIHFETPAEALSDAEQALAHQEQSDTDQAVV